MPAPVEYTHRLNTNNPSTNTTTTWAITSSFNDTEFQSVKHIAHYETSISGDITKVQKVHYEYQVGETISYVSNSKKTFQGVITNIAFNRTGKEASLRVALYDNGKYVSSITIKR